MLEKVYKNAHLRLIDPVLEDRIISYIQLHYKASQLATLCGIIQALLLSLHTPNL
jgi:hypothetical protein